MQRKAWLLLGALLVAPSAAAAYADASQLEADSPLQLDGRVDLLLPGGVATFLGEDKTLLLSLRAAEVNLRSVTYQECAPAAEPLAPTCTAPTSAPEPQVEEHVLDAAKLTLTRTLGAYKVVATTDRGYAATPQFGDGGRLLVTTAASTRVAANEAPRHLSATDAAWTSDDEQPASVHPIYTAPALAGEFSATGGIARATGGFQVLLQGVEARVEGVEDGAPFAQTFTTSYADDRSPARFLVLEVTEGELVATSSAPFLAFASAGDRPIADVRSVARMDGATGTIEYANGDTEEVRDAPLELDGPLSLTLTGVKDADGAPRLALTLADGLRIAGAPATPPEDEPLPTGALVAAGAAGAGGAGLLLAALYFWPRLKFALGLLAVPLYSRIQRNEVLEHEKRDELYELIRSTPGIHAHEIGEKAQIGWGTTVYHLKLLENHGLVVSKKDGRYKRFFVNTGEYTKKKDVYGALRNETAKAVAEYVHRNPGTTQKDLCAALGIQPSLASWHVEKLEGVDLVKRVKDGRMVRYYAGPAWEQLAPRAPPAGAGDVDPTAAS